MRIECPNCGAIWEVEEFTPYCLSCHELLEEESELPEPPDPAYQDLGWANGWKETPPIVKNCKEQKHQVIDFDHSGNRGLHHEVKCHICKYIYHYDSS